jgi:hypothetical protein
MNPENKSETFTKGKDINSVMCNHFNSFGKESSIDLKLKKKIELYAYGFDKPVICIFRFHCLNHVSCYESFLDDYIRIFLYSIYRVLYPKNLDNDLSS